MSLPRTVGGRLRDIFITTLMIIFVTAPLAQARDDQLGLSLDGRSWMPSLSTALFDPTTQWVPGDSRSASLFVKNQSADDASLTVDLVDLRGRSLLQSGAMKMLIMVDDKATRPVNGNLVTIPMTSPSEQTKITITVSFDTGANNETQGRALSFNLSVTLTQNPGDHASPSAPVPEKSPGLAGTGAPVGLGLLAIIGLTALIIGSVAIHRNNRKGNQP